MELATLMLLAMTISAIMMTLMQQQISFSRILRTQSFLVEEAPHINNSITHILATADAFRLHENLADAVADANAVTAGGKVLVVGFLNPDGTTEFGLVSFEENSGDPFLGYYRIDPGSPTVTAGNPDWVISHKVQNADFFVESGVFRMRLSGPAGEQITYSGTPRL